MQYDCGIRNEWRRGFGISLDLTLADCVSAAVVVGRWSRQECDLRPAR